MRLFTLFVACALISPLAAAKEALAQGSVHPIVAKARKLLDAGKYEEALAAYQDRWGWVEIDVLDRIAAARKTGDEQAEWGLSEFYLKLHPIEVSSSSFQFRPESDGSDFSLLSWWEIAIPYYKRHPGTSLSAKQTLASMGLFEKCVEACCKSKPSIDECRKLARELIHKYPKSAFCTAVVFNVCRLVDENDQGHEPSPVLDLCKQFLKQLERGGASQRSLLLVKALYARDLMYTGVGNHGGERRKPYLRRSLRLLQEVAEQTTRTREKVFYLFEAAQLAEGLDQQGTVKMRRKIFRRILAEFPTHYRHAEARLNVVWTYVEDGDLKRALEVVREFAEAGASTLDSELYLVAQAHAGRQELPQAQALCEEITKRYPRGAKIGSAFILLARIHKTMNREQAMLAAFIKAAKAQPVDTRSNLMDASNTKNEAHQFLGEYYFKKEDWKESLHWWETWNPSSWCSNCLMSMESSRKTQIDLCRDKLKQQSKTRQ